MKSVTILLFLLLAAPLARANEVSKGKKLFVERSCNACHAIGSEGTATTGPNLAGVMQKRKTSWVRRWLKNPDQMRNDPVIVKLTKQYKGTMPNLGLSDSDIKALIAYLRSVTH